ncbi:hypothetical protein ACS0TY_027155 [Phlomoides rotata]
MDVDNIAEVELEEEELLTVLYGIMNTFTTFLNMICAFFVLSKSELPTDVIYIRKCYSLGSRVPGHVLSILAHHTKNRIVKSNHIRSGRTVSKHFHRVLNFVIRFHSILLSQPRPIDENCTNERWKHFKVQLNIMGVLGALDGAYINVTVPVQDRARYRNRKVCDIHMNYVYVLTVWEESAADSRVLRNAITRNNEFRIPQGIVMENMSCNQTSNAAEKSGTSKRRIWSTHEEATLILCMREIIERGWKVDNGFRTGYQKVALKALKQKIPTTDLTADHIKNKIHVWKKFHTSLQGMLDTSGFEWDESRKIDPLAKSMKNKLFPFYKHWIDIFGKDKATGESTKDYNVVGGDPLNEGQATNVNYETDEYDGSTPTNMGQATSGKKKKSKKR